MSDIVHVIKFAGPPSEAPVRVGQHWVDTLNKEMYFSIGTDRIEDWKQLQLDTDVKVKVTPSDTTAEYLDKKITVSEKLSKEITEPGEAEKLHLDVVEAEVDHDLLKNFDLNKHIDWTRAGAGVIDPSNYQDNNIRDHLELANIGIKTHAQIDSFIELTNTRLAQIEARLAALEGQPNKPQ